MLALVQLARIAELAVIKRILQNERNARNVNATVSFAHYARVFKKYRQIIQCRAAARVAFKHLAHKRGVFLVDADSFGAWVVDVADRCEARINALPRFCAETASRIRSKLAHIFIRHTEFNGHHEHIVVRIMGAIVRLDMANDALLQKPLHLPAVHRIARKAVNFPADYSVRLASLNAAHHIAENRAAGLLGALFLYKLLGDFQILAPRQSTKLDQLRLDGEDLFVLDIGTFAGVEEIVHIAIVQ